jgi:hypothetical protein
MSVFPMIDTTPCKAVPCLGESMRGWPVDNGDCQRVLKTMNKTANTEFRGNIAIDKFNMKKPNLQITLLSVTS